MAALKLAAGAALHADESRSALVRSGHVLVGPRLEHLLGHVPHEDGTLGTNRDHGSLIGRDADLGDVAGVTDTVVVSDTFIVVPESDSLVLAARDEVLAGLSDGKSVDFAGLRAVKHADGLTIEAVPVGDLAVGASGDNLGLVRVVEDLLEHGGLKEAHDTSAVDDIPDDRGAVEGRGDSLRVRTVDLDVADAAAVLLQRALHDLSLATNSPDAHLTLVATGDDLLTVTGAGESSDTVVVRVVHGEEQLAGLRQEGTDLAVVPARHDCLTVMSEVDAVAVEAGNLNTEQLLSRLGVPHADVVETASGEELRVAVGEGDIVDALVVARVTELGRNVISVAPVDGGLRGAAEEVRRVGSQRDRGDSAHDLGRLLDEEVMGADLGDGTVAGTEKQVTVRKQLDALDALREESFSGTESLKDLLLEGDLHDVTSLGAEVGVRVSGVDHAAGEDTLDLVGEDLGVLHLLLDEVEVPRADAIVVDGEALARRVVEEANLVGDVHANRVSNERLAAFNLKTQIKFKSVARRGQNIIIDWINCEELRFATRHCIDSSTI